MHTLPGQIMPPRQHFFTAKRGKLVVAAHQAANIILGRIPNTFYKSVWYAGGPQRSSREVILPTPTPQ